LPLVEGASSKGRTVFIDGLYIRVGEWIPAYDLANKETAWLGGLSRRSSLQGDSRTCWRLPRRQDLLFHRAQTHRIRRVPRGLFQSKAPKFRYETLLKIVREVAVAPKPSCYLHWSALFSEADSDRAAATTARGASTAY